MSAYMKNVDFIFTIVNEEIQNLVDYQDNR